MTISSELSASVFKYPCNPISLELDSIKVFWLASENSFPAPEIALDQCCGLCNVALAGQSNAFEHLQPQLAGCKQWRGFHAHS